MQIFTLYFMGERMQDPFFDRLRKPLIFALFFNLTLFPPNHSPKLGINSTEGKYPLLPAASGRGVLLQDCHLCGQPAGESLTEALREDSR